MSLIFKLIKFNIINVIGLLSHEGTDVYYCLNVRKKGNSLNIISTSKYDSFDELKKNLPTKIPMLLLIDGKGILNKKIDTNSEKDISWQKNIDFTSIHFTQLQVLQDNFISFCRKAPIDEQIENFRKNGYEVLDFYVGPILAVLLHSALPIKQIWANDSILDFNNNLLIDISKNKEIEDKGYKVGDTQLSQYHLSLYGAAIHFFTQQNNITKSISTQINRDEIFYKKAFNNVGIAMLVSFFISLFVSYLLIQHYVSANVELKQENIYSNQTYQNIVKLQDQKIQKLKILTDTGQLSKNFLSFYAYEISKSVPITIQLNELNIFPVVKEVKSNERVNLTSQVIMLKGITTSEMAFDRWLDVVKKIKWIQKLEILSFKKNKKNILQFEIKILLNDF